MTRTRSERRFVWAVRIARIVIVVVAMRLLLAALAPTAAQLFARSHGFDTQWRSIRVHYLDAAIEVEDLAVAPRRDEEGLPSEPMLRAESLRLDVSMLAALSGRLRIERAELSGAQLIVERQAEDASPPVAPAPAPKDDATSADQPIDLALPVEIDALRIEGARIFVRDALASPGRQWRVDLDVRGDALGLEDGPGRLELRASAPELFDEARVVVDVGSQRDAARALVTLHAGGIRPSALAPFLHGVEADGTVARVDFDGRIEADARVTGARKDAIAGTLALKDWRVSTDGADVASLELAQLDLAALDSAGIHVAVGDVETGVFRARRDERGRLCALGFAIPPGAPSADADADCPEPPPPEALRIAADTLLVRAVEVSFEDRSVDPASELALRIESAEVNGFDTAPDDDAPLRVDAALSLPGIASRATLQGAAAVYSTRKAVDLALDIDGIDPREFQAQLRELGIECTLRSGHLAARLTGSGAELPDGRIEGDLRLSDCRLDDDRELFQMSSLELSGLSIDPRARRLRAGEIAVRGTSLPLARGADGSLEGFGLRTIRAPATRREAAAPPPPAAVGASSIDLPRIEIGRLRILENRLSWRDDSLPKPIDVVFDDCGLEVTELGLFGDSQRDAPATAKIKLWSRARDLVQSLAIEGTFATRPGPLDVTVDLAGSATGLLAHRLQPYIDPTGMEERINDASAAAALHVSLVDEGGRFRANVEVRDFELRNAEEQVLGAKLASVRDARFGDGRFSVDAIGIESGRVNVRRDPTGALLALGLRIPLSVFRGAAQEPSATPAAEESSSKAERILAELPDVEVRSIRVRDAVLAWRDAALDPPVSSSARMDLEIDDFATRKPDGTTRFQVAIGVGDSAERIQVAGSANLRADGAAIEASCVAKGLRPGALAPYLPQGVECDLSAGELAFDGRIAVAQHAGGGLSANVSVANARLDDGARHLFALKLLDLRVGRADPLAGVFEIAALRTDGLEAEIRRASDGTLHALGFTMPAEAIPAESTPPPSPGPRFDLSAHGTPRIVIGDLALDVARLAYYDDSRGADPIVLSVRLSAPPDQTIVDQDPARIPPTRLSIEGAVVPLVRRWRCDLELAPWVEEPRVSAQFSAEGISGGGLAAFDPSLATWIDGSLLTDGVASGSIEARLRWKRRSPLDLDLRGGFSGELSVGRLELRDAPDGAVLAALDGVDAEIERVDLARGIIRVKELEVRKPELRAWRADDGVHVLGVIAHPERRPPAEAETVAVHTQEASAAAPPGDGELRIDELRVQGISVELRDDAAVPPTVIPLADLDVLVQRFTTRAFREPRSIRFDAWLGAGATDLPRSVRADNVIAGIATAMGSVVAGSDEAPQLQRRPLFEEAVLSGSVQLYPHLSGYAQASLTGFELVGLRGTAQREGLDVGDGTLDASMRVRLRGESGVRVDSQFVFSDLSLSEPKSGPVETYLSLPVPLDALLFLLRNSNGEHRIAVGFTVDEEGLSGTEITRAAAGAATSVIAGAVAAAPVRIATTFTDLFGITGAAKPSGQSAEIDFAPGSAAFSAEENRQLERLVARMRANPRLILQAQHRFGSADVERADRLANPSVEDCTELATGLRRRKAELSRSRAELAADARALWGLGERKAAEAASERLRELDAATGSAEDALDRVFELVKPGAERHRQKRTGSAALAVARARMDALQAWLTEQGVENLETRFESKSPAFDAQPDSGGGKLLVVVRQRP